MMAGGRADSDKNGCEKTAKKTGLLDSEAHATVA